MTNQIKGTCGHVSSREEPFTVLSVSITNCSTLHAALSAHTAKEELSGDNAYACSTCEGKVNAVKRLCIRALPPTLFIHLKRFEFNFDTMTKQKLNTRCEFPMTLDLLEFTEQGLAAAEGTPLPPSECQPASSFVYDLVGVVVHTGTSEQGHYFSYIRESAPDATQSRWLEFNDQSVTPFNVARLEAECFGGDVLVWEWDATEEKHVLMAQERPQSAYMLVYEQRVARTPSPAASGGAGSTSVESMIEAELPGMPTSVHRAVWAENARLASDRLVFDDLYGRTIRDIVSYCVTTLSIALRVDGSGQLLLPLEQHVHAKYKPSTSMTSSSSSATEAGAGDGGSDTSDADDPRNQDEDNCVLLSTKALKLASMYFLEVAVFSSDTSRVRDWVSTLTRMMRLNQPACAWFLDWITANPRTIERGLLECRDVRFRQAIAILIQNACRIVYASERALLSVTDDPCVQPGPQSADADACRPRAVVGRLASVLLRVLPFIHDHWRRFEQYLHVLSVTADLGPEACGWLLHHKAVLKVLDLFLGDKSPIMPRRVRRAPIDDAKVQPMWVPLLHLLATLVCHIRTPGMGHADDYTAELRAQLQLAREQKARLAAVHAAGTGAADAGVAAPRARPPPAPPRSQPGLVDNDTSGSEDDDNIDDVIETLEAQLTLHQTEPPTYRGGVRYAMTDKELELLCDPHTLSQLFRFAMQAPSVAILGEKYKDEELLGTPDLLVHICWNCEPISNRVIDVRIRHALSVALPGVVDLAVTRLLVLGADHSARA